MVFYVRAKDSFLEALALNTQLARILSEQGQPGSSMALFAPTPLQRPPHSNNSQDSKIALLQGHEITDYTVIDDSDLAIAHSSSTYQPTAKVCFKHGQKGDSIKRRRNYKSTSRK